MLNPKPTHSGQKKKQRPRQQQQQQQTESRRWEIPTAERKVCGQCVTYINVSCQNIVSRLLALSLFSLSMSRCCKHKRTHPIRHGVHVAICFVIYVPSGFL